MVFKVVVFCIAGAVCVIQRYPADVLELIHFELTRIYTLCPFVSPHWTMKAT